MTIKLKPEPRARNLYGLINWTRLKGEEERHHFNKVYASLFFNKEEFTSIDIPMEEWDLMCKKIALKSSLILRRGKSLKYWERTY